jgi:NADPH:quinone reductase-like Zn-dependent oxidoreductase
MRALISTPKASAPVELRDGLAEPTPAPDEAVIAVRAAGINRGELRLLATRDQWGPGQDVAGEVVRAAADGSGPPVGARVVALVDMGGWAERVAPVDRIGVLPDGVSFAAAASLPVAALTALRALRAGGPLIGRRVLVTGAAGGVGRFAVELAARGGAAAVAAVVRDVATRGAGLRELGATEVVTAVSAATSGPFDIALESVGGATLTETVNALAADGIALVFGNSSNEPSTITFAELRGLPRRRVQGFGVYTSGPGLGEDLRFLVALVGRGELHPETGTPWAWRDAPAALAALRDRTVNGKAILLLD